jgi:hypothetical protein
MEYEYLSNRVKALQFELVEIAEHNRQYFATKYHPPIDRAQHQELRERGLSNSCRAVRPDGTDGGIKKFTT